MSRLHLSLFIYIMFPVCKGEKSEIVLFALGREEMMGHIIHMQGLVKN